MKKRGFGDGKWNGAGGKVAEGETIEDAMKREAKEEIGVEVKDFYKVAELTFKHPHVSGNEWDQVVHTYVAISWEGEPGESEEMKPQWFSPEEIPYDKCWPDDKIWVPMVLADKKLKARFVFDANGEIAEEEVTEVESL